MKSGGKVKVLFFKAKKKDVDIDPYEKLLAESNEFAQIEVYFAPVLSYVFSLDGMEQVATLLQIQIQHKLEQKISRHIVLTSPRAADAVVSVISKLGLKPDVSDDAAVITIPNTFWYVVGNETGARLRKGGLSYQGSESGSAQELGRFLIEKGIASVTFLCGDKRRDTLPNLLSENQIACEEIRLYESVEEETVIVPDGFFEENADRWCVFFSPSGVRCMSRENNYKNLMESIPGDIKQSRLPVKCMAIGKTTAGEISAEKHKHLWKIGTTALKPSPQGVYDALSSYYRSCS
mmetsp:Transcript_8485/g.10729  ORF Transcript_8485/g.10729 Transcript_8485/m.10729 type:complete len:292 (+) Transcript_8485:54-929(+)